MPKKSLQTDTKHGVSPLAHAVTQHRSTLGAAE